MINIWNTTLSNTLLLEIFFQIPHLFVFIPIHANREKNVQTIAYYNMAATETSGLFKKKLDKII